MQVSTTPLHPFCTSSISTSTNTVSVKKTSNIQVVEIQITSWDGRHLVNYNKIHEKLQALWVWINKDTDNRGSDNQGCTVLLLNIAQFLQMAGLYLKMKENNLCMKHKKRLWLSLNKPHESELVPPQVWWRQCQARRTQGLSQWAVMNWLH